MSGMFVLGDAVRATVGKRRGSLRDLAPDVERFLDGRAGLDPAGVDSLARSLGLANRWELFEVTLTEATPGHASSCDGTCLAGDPASFVRFDQTTGTRGHMIFEMVMEMFRQGRATPYKIERFNDHGERIGPRWYALSCEAVVAQRAVSGALDYALN